MKLATEIEKLTEISHPFASTEVLADAVRAVVTTCDIQLERDYAARDGNPDLQGVVCGSSITLNSPSGSVILAILCDLPSGESLARLLFAMDGDEDVPLEDLNDALGELINVAGGVFKGFRSKLGQTYSMGLPIPLGIHSRTDFTLSDTMGLTQLLKHADGTSIQVHLIWQERAGQCHSSCP